MNKVLHDIIGARHYPHKNNTPKPGALKSLSDNVSDFDFFLPHGKTQNDINIVNAKLVGTDQARTRGTSLEIAKTLNVPIRDFQIKDWLSIKPKNSPANVKEILKKIDVLYDADPSVKANGYSDELVYKIQRNTLEDIDVRPFARFTTNKLYNIIQAVKRNPEASNLTIAGIHGGRWLETVLYTLWGENMPKEWEGQLRMSEPFAIYIMESDEPGKVELVVNYRGVERYIGEDEIKEKIDALKS